MQKKWTAHKVPREYDDILQCLCRIPFLRPDLIKHAINALRKKVARINNEKLNSFFTYFIVQWGDDRMAELMSIFGEEYRTTGTCEHFHRELFKLVGAHPQLYKFVGNYNCILYKFTFVSSLSTISSETVEP